MTYTGQILTNEPRKLTTAQELATILENDGVDNWEARINLEGRKSWVFPIRDGRAIQVVTWVGVYAEANPERWIIATEPTPAGVAEVVGQLLGSKLGQADFHRVARWIA